MINFGARSTHETSNADHCIVAINNDEISRAVAKPTTGIAERSFDLIQGDDLLAWSGGANAKVRACNLLEVIGMSWLSKLQHDVVGGINHIGDGTHSGQGQPTLNP